MMVHTRRHSWRAIGQPGRAAKIVLTFLLVGPLVGWVAVYFGMMLANMAQNGATALQIDQFFVGFLFAHLFGGLPALLVGVFVAWRTWRSRQVSLLAVALAAAVAAFVFGYALDVVTQTAGADPLPLVASLKPIVLLLVLPSVFAAVVCTWLTRRWQA
ncbi:MAG: hypothetical protein ABL898_19815 [Hyphomicrobiaceae bacterium]|nr:hypothetical protein [Hyphomicrobiaceae bacterium]